MSAAKQQKQIKERPIIMQPESVRAILDGRKTMTRRVIKPQAKSYRGDVLGQPYIYAVEESGYCDPKPIACPDGKIGDYLWVRETLYMKDEKIHYRADDSPVDESRIPDDAKTITKAILPSLIMPRWASRISLEITGVKVERLQDITDDDIWNEGIRLSGSIGGTSYRDKWQWGWNEINGKRKGCDWNSNPFVWVIEFKKVEPTQAPQ
jgi:hypothetical protein